MSIRCRVSIAVLLCAAQAHADEPAAPQPEPGHRQGAAETVQEGNVDQWLQHYQRERGDNWPQPRQVKPNAGAEPDERAANSSNAAGPALPAR